MWNFGIKIFKFGQSVQKLWYFCVIKYFLASEYSFAEMIVLPQSFCIISIFDLQQWLRRVTFILFGDFWGDFLAHSHPLTIIIVKKKFCKSISHSYETWTIAKDKGARFEKTLNMNIHYSQTLVLKKDFFENHLHTLTNLPFYTGPKDMADPVV